SPNRLILPRMRSETRGCVTPNTLAACDWLRPARAICSFSAIMSTERSFMFSAASEVSSMASHTLTNRCLLICPSPSTTRGSVCPPDPDRPWTSCPSFSGSSEARTRHRRTSRHTPRERCRPRPKCESPEHLARPRTAASSRPVPGRAAPGRSDAPPHAEHRQEKRAGHRVNFPGTRRALVRSRELVYKILYGCARKAWARPESGERLDEILAAMPQNVGAAAEGGRRTRHAVPSWDRV